MREPTYPLAIAMWDFSWLERRWPGAGYEDWDTAVGELVERGYNAVRIDAFPYLLAADPEREWTLDPHWDNQAWGSPAVNRVRVQPNLNRFLETCARYGVRVALSTWWREDQDRLAERIRSPRELGEIWVKALRTIDPSLLSLIEFVDLNNEFPIRVWTPYLPDGFVRNSPEGERWMRESIAVVREAFPELRYTFSFTTEYDRWRSEKVDFLDLLELHIWMTHFTDFYQKVGYRFERWGNEGYRNLALHGEAEYRRNEAFYRQKLVAGIQDLAEWSRVSGKPLATTECWGIVDYKDWPLLDWGWVKELCELGTRTAAATGRWKWIATSNFCGPQFVGMWRDVDWHRRLTRLIRSAPVAPELIEG
ncbi:MAG: hypothetical protein Kow00109_08800 [Acidobacteriota bacterium]